MNNDKLTFKVPLATIVCLCVAAWIAFSIASSFYEANIFTQIDQYSEFIFGDTIFLSYSKDVDFLLVPLFVLSFGICFIAGYFINKYIIKNKRCFEISLPSFTLDCAKLDTGLFFALLIAFSYFAARILAALLNVGGTNIITFFLFLLFLAPYFCTQNKSSILVPQLLFPIVYFTFLQNVTLSVSDASITFQFSAFLRIFMLLLFVASYGFIYIALKQKQYTSFSTVMFFVFLKFGTIAKSSFVYLTDEYHNGERITTFQQIFLLGQDMYQEYTPVKGWMHIIIALCDYLFFDENYAMVALSVALGQVIAIGLVCFILWLFWKHKYATELILFFLIIGMFKLNFALLAPVFLILLTRKKIYENSYNFIIAYCYFAYIYVMYYQSFGVAFAASLFPIFLIKAIDVVKNKAKPNKPQIVLFVAGMILAALNFSIITGIIEYCLTNASSNQFYWGNQSGFSDSDENSDFWLTVMSKSFWVLIWLSCVSILIVQRKRLAHFHRIEKVFISFLICYPLFIYSYMYGRLDKTYDRASVYTYVACMTLVLLSILMIHRKSFYKYLLVLVLSSSLFLSAFSTTTISATLNLADNINFTHDYSYADSYTLLAPTQSFQASNLNSDTVSNGVSIDSAIFVVDFEQSIFDNLNSNSYIEVNGKQINLVSVTSADGYILVTVDSNANALKCQYPQDITVNTSAEGIPNLQLGVVDTTVYEELQSEYLFFHTILNDDETYLDIADYTSESAKYYIYDMVIPTVSHSLLNVTTMTSQAAELEKTIRHDVKLVKYTTTGLKRYYVFYEYYIDKIISGEFVNTTYNDCTYFMEAELFERYKEEFGLEIVEIDVATYSRASLYMLPVKWGQAVDGTSENIEAIYNNFTLASYNGVEIGDDCITVIDNTNPYIIYAVDRPIEGSTIDYFYYEIETTQETLTSECFWATDTSVFSEENNVNYTIVDGGILLPLGMHLGWRTNAEINYIKLDFSGTENGDTISIQNPTLFAHNY